MVDADNSLMGSRSSAILPYLKPKPPPEPLARHQHSTIAPHVSACEHSTDYSFDNCVTVI
jgi:hypothetical protein